MDGIPITFEYKGKNYKGHFSKVSGASARVWHLMIGNYYYGALHLTKKNGWVFYGNKMTELADYFGDYLTAWYE